MQLGASMRATDLTSNIWSNQQVQWWHLWVHLDSWRIAAPLDNDGRPRLLFNAGQDMPTSEQRPRFTCLIVYAERLCDSGAEALHKSTATMTMQ
jgi:hypothetical protein